MQHHATNLFKTSLLSLAVSVISTNSVNAATMTVTTFADEINNNGSCSLREAIINANSNSTSGSIDCAAGINTGVDEIILAAGTYTLSIVGRSEDASLTGDLDITDIDTNGASLVITGATDGVSGAPTTIIDANDIDRVFDIFSPGFKDNLAQGANFDAVEITLQNLKLINGHVEETTIAVDNQANGGAVFSWRFNSLNISNCVFDNNQVVWDGKYGVIDVDPDGIPANGDEYQVDERTLSGHGGAVFSRGQVAVQNSTFSNNIAFTTFDENGDGIIEGENEKSGNGGGLFIAFTSTIENSTFNSNTASNGGGMNTTGGEPAIAPGNMTVSGSTFYDNWAVMGGGINNVSPQVTLDIFNSTFSGNTSTDMGGGVNSDAAVHLKHATIVNNKVTNSDQHGAGINYFGPAGQFFLSNTLLSNNTGKKVLVNCGCTGGVILACSTLEVTSLGGNISSDFNCGLSTAGGDLQGPDPDILPLADNGGLTQTHALDYNSLAIDAGKDTNCVTATPAIITDQRGASRLPLVDGNADAVAGCDVGAYERQTVNSDLVLTNFSLSANTVEVDEQFDITATAGNTGPGTVSAARIDVAMPASIEFVSGAVTGGAACTSLGSTISCELGDMVATASSSISVTVSAIDDGTSSISANVSALEVDVDTSNNDANSSVTINPKPVVATSSSSGGLCSYNPNAEVDLVLPAILLMALSYLGFRRYKEG